MDPKSDKGNLVENFVIVPRRVPGNYDLLLELGG